MSTDILESVDAAYADQVYILEVSEDIPFGLNLYECENSKSSLAVNRVVDNSILVFKRLMQDERGFHPHIEFLLRNLGYMLLANPSHTLAEAGMLFEQSEAGKALRSHLLQKVASRDVQSFWKGVDERKGNLAYQYVEPLLNKISPFTIAEPFRLIVGQNKTTIPFSEFLDTPGKTLIVNLPIGVLGEEKTQMLGMTFLSLLSEQIYERVNQRKASRIPVHLYIDEAGLFFSSGTAISKLLKQGRKFGCATHLSFQTLSDLPDKEAQSAVLQVGSLVLFQVIGGTDAEILSKQLQVKQPPVEPMPKMRMEPNIKEWDEEVWTDPNAQWICEHAGIYIDNETEQKRKKLGALVMLEGYVRYCPATSMKMTEEGKRKALAEMKEESGWVAADDGSYLDIFAHRRFKYILNSAREPIPFYGNFEIPIDRAQTAQLFREFTAQFQQFPLMQIPNLLQDYKDILDVRIQTLVAEIETDIAHSLEEIKELRKKHYQVVHHREQDGFLPVKLQEERSSTSSHLNYSRRGPAYIDRTYTSTHDIQIYDMVEGSPRMFSDLWNEMQANLATLPPYHYYMQTINENKEIIDSQHQSAKPPNAQPYGEIQAEQIRERSLLRFGRPADQVRRELQERISPFLGGSDDDKPDTGKSGPKPKSGTNGPPISGAKPYP